MLYRLKTLILLKITNTFSEDPSLAFPDIFYRLVRFNRKGVESSTNILCRRQIEREGCSLAWFRVDADAAVGCLQQAVYYRKTESAVDF